MSAKNPVYNYTSACCSQPTRKPPCEVGDDKGKSSLGKWKCGACKKSCKVTRRKRGADKE